MTTATQPDYGAAAAPSERPPRMDLLAPMLRGTGRTFVPIRRAFVQKPRDTRGPRGGRLTLLARDSSALDAYLLIHALASSSEPYLAAYPAATWVQLARLDRAASFAAAKSRWSKIVTKLEKIQLVERTRKGNDMQYQLLDESGDGSAYARPTKTAHGNWLRLPHSYWLEGFDAALSHAEKLMLLIALDQPDEFILPFNRSADWYGISEATARRGLRGLAARGLLTATSSFVVSPRSPTGWAEQFRYTLQGPFSRAAIEAAQAASRNKVTFTATSDS